MGRWAKYRPNKPSYIDRSPREYLIRLVYKDQTIHYIPVWATTEENARRFAIREAERIMKAGVVMSSQVLVDGET